MLSYGSGYCTSEVSKMIILKVVITIILVMVIFAGGVIALGLVIPEVYDWVYESKLMDVIITILTVFLILSLVILFLGLIIGLFWVIWVR